MQETIEPTPGPENVDSNEMTNNTCENVSAVEIEQNTTEAKPNSPVTTAVSAPPSVNATTNNDSNLVADQHSVDEEAIDQMDFEEISDEELEEETKVKGLGDALGVDWASLVAESRPRLKTVASGSAKKRWEPHRVLARIGISIQMAGVEMTNNIFEKLKDDEPMENSIEQDQSHAETKNKVEETEVKTEMCNGTLEKKVNSENINSIAGMQVALRDWTIKRRTLFATAGPFKRALCARRDLDIRRYLCKLPTKDTIGLGDGQHAHDPEMFKMALKLYERTL